MKKAKFLYYTNKKSHELEAQEIPEVCPNCKRKGQNFILLEVDEPGLGTGIIDTHVIQCSYCGWEKDITPYELA